MRPDPLPRMPARRPVRRPIRRWVAAAIGAALLATSACSAEPAEGSPVDRLARVQDAWRIRAGVPAVVVAVRRPGELSWTRASGAALRGRPSPPLEADAGFRVGSITKTFVAVVLLQLADEHRVGLDDPLARYVPDYPGGDRITLRQLLSHTSGVPDHETVDEQHGRALLRDRSRRWDPAELIRTAASVRPDFDRGTRYGYSNTGYLLLGEVIAAVTGRDWAVEVRERILDPLHLDDTYVAGGEPGPAVVPAYFDTDGDGDEENVETGLAWTSLETSEGAAGAVVSTADDLATFGDALFHGRLLGPHAQEQLVAEHPFHPRTSNYGLGVEIRRPDYQTLLLGHTGFVPGFRSTLWYLPDRDLTVAVVANSSAANTSDLAELVWRSFGT